MVFKYRFSYKEYLGLMEKGSPPDEFNIQCGDFGVTLTEIFVGAVALRLERKYSIYSSDLEKICLIATFIEDYGVKLLTKVLMTKTHSLKILVQS